MPTSRRTFLKNSGLLVGAFTIVPRFVLGKGYTAPSDRITLGLIGCGRQSGIVRRFIGRTEAEILACSDLFTEKMQEFQEKTVAAYAEHRDKPDYKGLQYYLDYEELLARTDIDGVVICTPDHWHAVMAIKAMKAGKDVYCEKPLTHDVSEGIAMVKAAKKYQRIVQTGSMQRSSKRFLHACELVRNGYIGAIKKVLVNVGSPARPYDLEAQPIPKDFNWNAWCGPSTVGPYNALLAPPRNTGLDYWPKWRDYKEYGGGILCDWGAHMFDIAQWGLGMDQSGPVKYIPPKDPEAVRGLRMLYANGIEMVHEDFERGWAVRFIGTEGQLDVSRKFLDSKPENIVTAEIKAGEVRLYDTAENHYEDWIQAIKKRSEPVCSVETGHRSATICNIANIAYQLNRPLQWDPAKERFVGDKEANKHLGTKARKPYGL